MLATLAAVLLTAPGAAAAASPTDYFAINAQGVFALPQDQWQPQADAIAHDGFTAVRYDAFWDDVEPHAPVLDVRTYAWQRLDAIVTALSRAHLRWLPIVDYSARWASQQPGQWRAGPAGTADYAAYAGALARRYGPGGAFWRLHPDLPEQPVTSYEIWNEPNWRSFWLPSPDAPKYAALYLAAREEIRSVDPSATLVVGGLTGDTAASFLDAMYAAHPELHGNLDAVGLHPYAEQPDDVLGRVAAVRATLDQHGDTGVPVQLTEVGWPTSGGPISTRATDQQRATRLVALIAAARMDGCISRIVPFTWLSAEQNVDDSEDWFGMHHPDGSASATELAVTAAIHSAQDLGAGPACGKPNDPEPPSPDPAAQPEPPTTPAQPVTPAQPLPPTPATSLVGPPCACTGLPPAATPRPPAPLVVRLHRTSLAGALRHGITVTVNSGAAGHMSITARLGHSRTSAQVRRNLPNGREQVRLRWRGRASHGLKAGKREALRVRVTFYPAAGGVPRHATRSLVLSR